MFSFFKKKSGVKTPELVVFTTKVQLYKWLIDDCRDTTCVLFYFFDETGKELEVLLKAANIDNARPVEWSKAGGIAIPKKAYIVELYPLSAPYDTLMERLTSHPDCQVVPLSHLESPIFLKFGGERLMNVIGRLGMKENESISHSMVTRAVSNLQKKLDTKIVSEKKTASIESWFQENKIEVD
jgi:hypothetical protein